MLLQYGRTEGLPTIKFYKREVSKSARAWPAAFLRTIPAVHLYDALARVLARRRSFTLFEI